MIERHWDGIAAYCRPENKVSLGFVEGLNNKIRVIQRRFETKLAGFVMGSMRPPGRAFGSPVLHAGDHALP